MIGDIVGCGKLSRIFSAEVSVILFVMESNFDCEFKKGGFSKN